MTKASCLALAPTLAVLFLSSTLGAEPYSAWLAAIERAVVSFFKCAGKLRGKVIGKGSSSAKVSTMIVGGARRTGAHMRALGNSCQGEAWQKVK